MEEEKIYCTHCGDIIEGDDYDTIYGEPICQDCIDSYAVTCDRCDEFIWDSDAYSDDNICLCGRCYDNYYTRCEQCDTIIHNDDTYEYDDGYYCHDCYQDIAETIQFTNTATSLNRFSTVIQIAISAWNLKSMEQAKIMIMPKKFLISPTSTTNAST